MKTKLLKHVGSYEFPNTKLQASDSVSAATFTHYMVQSLIIWYSHSLYGTFTHYMVQSLIICYCHSLYGTVTHYMVRSLIIWYSHLLYGTFTRYMVQSPVKVRGVLDNASFEQI